MLLSFLIPSSVIMTFRPANHRRPHQTGPDGCRDQRQGNTGEQVAPPTSRCVARLLVLLCVCVCCLSQLDVTHSRYIQSKPSSRADIRAASLFRYQMFSLGHLSHSLLPSLYLCQTAFLFSISLHIRLSFFF